MVAIEGKLSATVYDDLKNVKWLRECIGDPLLDAVLGSTGRDAYRRPDWIAVITAAVLGP